MLCKTDYPAKSVVIGTKFETWYGFDERLAFTSNSHDSAEEQL